MPTEIIFTPRENSSPPLECEGMVVVDSGDALLITTVSRSQDVGKIVKHLDQQKQSKLV